MKRSRADTITDDAMQRRSATLSDLPAHVLANVMQGQCAVQAMRLGHVNAALRAKIPYPVRPVEGVPGKSTLVMSDFWTHWTDLRYPRGAATLDDHRRFPEWVNAAADGHVLCVQMAIHRGVDTNHNDFGPLTDVVLRRRVVMASVLMHDAMAHKPMMQVPLDRLSVMSCLLTNAVERGRLELSHYILRTCPDLGDVSWAFCLACARGQTDLVRAFLRGAPGFHVDVNVLHDPPLVRACKNGHVDVVRMLLDAGADPRLTFQTYNALWAASENGHVPVVHLLLADDRIARNRAMIEDAAYRARGSGQTAVDERLKAHLRQLDARR